MRVHKLTRMAKCDGCGSVERSIKLFIDDMNGKTLIALCLPCWESLERAVGRKQLDSKPPSPYPPCPQCGAPTILRERRPDGNDYCENGHVYKSRDWRDINEDK